MADKMRLGGAGQQGVAELLVPAQRNEPDGKDVTYLDLTSGKLLNHSQDLDGRRITHRDDHPCPRPQLFDQRLGDVLGPCRDEDSVERALLGPSEVPVSGTDYHVRNSQSLESVGRRACQLRSDLDTVDLGDQFGRNGGLVSRARSDSPVSGRPAPRERARSSGRRCRVVKSSARTRSAGVYHCRRTPDRAQGRTRGEGPATWLQEPGSR